MVDRTGRSESVYRSKKLGKGRCCRQYMGLYTLVAAEEM
jgi:hypothetical protein